MIDKAGLFVVLFWWKKVPSCFTSGDGVCLSAALGALSVSCLVTSCAILSCCRCRLRAGLSGHDAVWVLYSFIGDLCNVAGAFLSGQSPLQIVVASCMVALDGLRFISVAVPVCLWYYSKTGTRARMLRMRRRQNSLVVCLLFVVGGCVYFGTEVHHSQVLGNKSLAGRRLLGVFLHGPIELLGYALGLLSFVISWTSRIPSFFSAKRGELSGADHVSSRALSASAGALYAAALLLYDTRLEFAVRALPWILSGASVALLDVAILVLSCSRIGCSRRAARLSDPAAQSLLGNCRRPASAQYLYPRDQTIRKHHLFARKKNSPNMAEMGRYMDVNVPPVRKVCLKEVTLTREGLVDSKPLTRSVKVVRVDERSSDSASDSSFSLSSELQWDFEAQWGSGKADGRTTQAFPLQEWMVDHGSKFSSGSTSRTCFCNGATLEAEMVSTSLDKNLSCSDC